jgi:hypothetical protein
VCLGLWSVAKDTESEVSCATVDENARFGALVALLYVVFELFVELTYFVV